MSEATTINGIAVKASTSLNGITYTAKELKKASAGLSDVPILKDHVATTDNTIGRTTTAHFDESSESIMYSGWIKDSGVAEKVRDGRIKNVSIGASATLVKESKDSDQIIAKNIKFMELSTTPTPGVQGTQISVEQKKVKPLQQKKEEVISMTETKEQVADNSAELAEMKAKLEEANKLIQEKETILKNIEEETLANLRNKVKEQSDLPEAVVETFTKEQAEAVLADLEEKGKRKKELQEKAAVETKAEVGTQEEAPKEESDLRMTQSEDAYGVTEVWKVASYDVSKLPGGY